ncbi:pyocin knob domain-containing protein, partial [Acinetobacter baumannii]
FGIGGRQTLGDKDLNDVKIPGDYQQDRSSDATPARNYPINTAGYLNVKQTVNGWGNGCIQQYHIYAGVGYFQRTWNGSDWSGWDRFVSENSPLIKNMQGDIKGKADLNSGNSQRFRSSLIAEPSIGAAKGGMRLFIDLKSDKFAFVYSKGDGVWHGNQLPGKNGTLMLVGDYGVGGNSISLSKKAMLDKYQSCLFGSTGIGAGEFPWGVGVHIVENVYGGGFLYRPDNKKFYTFTSDKTKDSVGNLNEVFSEANTTVDSNGFIKRASPVININPDGTFTTNDESEGATVTRVAQGEYLIEGVLGFNSDAGWGGVDGGIEIPLDVNKQPLIWVDSKVMKDGSILVRTYHRTHTNAPKFARNDIDGYKDGDPIDIPAGRFISVRVQMPEQSIYNVRMREMEEAQKAEEERRQKEEEENFPNIVFNKKGDL